MASLSNQCRREEVVGGEPDAPHPKHLADDVGELCVRQRVVRRGTRSSGAVKSGPMRGGAERSSTCQRDPRPGTR